MTRMAFRTTHHIPASTDDPMIAIARSFIIDGEARNWEGSEPFQFIWSATPERAYGVNRRRRPDLAPGIVDYYFVPTVFGNGPPIGLRSFAYPHRTIVSITFGEMTENERRAPVWNDR